MTESISLGVVDATYGQPEFIARVWEQRYAHHPGETWDEACTRLASHVAGAEAPEKYQQVFEDFREALIYRRFMPGGRIWHGAGRPNGQLLNCFVVPIDDTLPAWLRAHEETALVSAARGGVGLNFSRIRPAGSVSRQGSAGGPCMAMRMIEHTISLLRHTGGRRGALMFCLNRDHPDVEEFLHLKDTDGSLSHANISINYNSSVREHMRNGDPVFDASIERACLHGEPGLLNGALANEESNIWYFRELISTNPCGEIWLEPYGCCCLGHLVLPELVRNGQWDTQLIRDTVKRAVRFLDNVLTVNSYPLLAIEENCQRVRRIGLGVTGLHHALMLRGVAYESSTEEVAGLFELVRDAAYLASIELAIEKGPFQRYDSRMLASGFCQRLPRGIRTAIDCSGIRNCALLTVAPTGTVSTVLDVSPGIEPIMGRSYSRIWDDGGVWTRVACGDPVAGTVDASLVSSGIEIPLEAHLAVQAAAQHYIDNSVSKTINVPSGMDPKLVAKTVAEYLPSLKGVTIYPAGAREGSPFESLDPECPGGVCEL